MTTTEFWLGLRKISALTSEGSWELVVELTAYNGSTYTARYTGFRVADAADKYRLEYDKYDKENSTVGTFDALEHSKGEQFSTMDQDNDRWSDGSCSVERRGGGGWWFGNCGSHLTGLNHNEETDGTATGIRWYHSPAILPAGPSGSWPDAVMKMRRTDGAQITTSTTSLSTTAPITTNAIESSVNSSVIIGLIVVVVLSLLTVAGLTIAILRMKMRNQNSNPTPTNPTNQEQQQQQAAPREFGSSVMADGRPRRKEDLLYENDDQSGEEYYGRLGNYNSRENSVEYI